jgi:hypothetical protein
MHTIRVTPRWELSFAVLAACGGLAIASARADEPEQEARALASRYAAAVEALAAWCEQHHLKAEAGQTRGVLVRHDPYKLFLPVLPRQVGPPQPEPSAGAEVAEWNARLLALRRGQAAALYDLACRAEAKHQRWLACQLVLRGIREDPDHEGLRRVLGYQKYRDQWHTAYEIKRLRAGMVWHEKFGWLNPANVERYERGERLSGGRWISAEADARLHAAINRGWEIETEHYLIRTNDSIEAAVALGGKLEILNRLWKQLFLGYYASEAYVDALFGGAGQARRPDLPRLDVVFYRSREDYNRSLRLIEPNITVSAGFYDPKRHVAHFFPGGEDIDRVTYHEATHQLFQQSRRVANDVGRWANFWLVEGIAMYMESLHQEDGDYVLGGLDDARMNAARDHLFLQDFYVPWAELSRMGMSQLQTHPKLARLYSQMAAMTHFLIDGEGGRYRDTLVGCLTALYSGNQDPDLLTERTGVSYEELDRQYHAYMKRTPPSAAGGK